jgi:hypothetical protein
MPNAKKAQKVRLDHASKVSLRYIDRSCDPKLQRVGFPTPIVSNRTPGVTASAGGKLGFENMFSSALGPTMLTSLTSVVPVAARTGRRDGMPSRGECFAHARLEFLRCRV